MNVKLVYMFNNVPGIYFPPGETKFGGTCEFASKKCIKVCAAFKNATDTNKIGWDKKCAVFSDITKGEPHNIILRISNEVKNMKSELLYWFASGDCPSEFTDEIAYIIEGLSFIIPAQNGFTRNQELWEKVNKFDNVKIALTLEKPYKSKLQQMSSLGTIAVPNYNTGIINLYTCNRSYTSCGANLVYIKTLDKIEERDADCNICYKEKIGCFKEAD